MSMRPAAQTDDAGATRSNRKERRAPERLPWSFAAGLIAVASAGLWAGLIKLALLML